MNLGENSNQQCKQRSKPIVGLTCDWEPCRNDHRPTLSVGLYSSAENTAMKEKFTVIEIQ